jgi:hypothetical protein
LVVANACSAAVRNVQAQDDLKVIQRYQGDQLAEEMYALAACASLPSTVSRLNRSFGQCGDLAVRQASILPGRFAVRRA